MSLSYDEYLEEGLKNIINNLKIAHNFRKIPVNELREKIEGAKRAFASYEGENVIDAVKDEQRRVQNALKAVGREHDKERIDHATRNQIDRERLYRAVGHDDERYKLLTAYAEWLNDFVENINCESFGAYLESLEADDYSEYLTEGLFNKKEKVEIEVIYDDWEAHCTAYKVGDSVHVLKSISIDLPEKFHSNSNDEWDKDLKKGEWEKIFLNHVKKAAKGHFKEYKVVKWFVH